MKNIIIGGAMRSGTTLMNNILCHIPDTNPHLPECQILLSLCSLYINESPHFEDFNQAYFADKNAFDQYCAEMAKKIFSNVRQKYHCQNVVLKHPESTQVFAELNRLLDGDALFFIMLRHPLDTIASMAKVGEKLKKQGMKHFLVERDIAKYIKIFLGYYERVFTTLKSPNVQWLKYEDLVQNPASTIKQIETFTGCDLSTYKAGQPWGKIDRTEEEYLKPGGRGVSAFVESFRSDLYGKPVSKEGLDQYKTILTPAEIDLIKTRCANFMQGFGYSS